MITLGALTILTLTALFAFALTLPQPQPATYVAAATTPVEEAARILASRYASGAITDTEYERMLVMLRS